MIDPNPDLHSGDAVLFRQADEENLRLLTSFNDIFVCLAAFLFIGAITLLGNMVSEFFGDAAAAVSCWLLAEHFTRRRRMALPSILLMLGFVAYSMAFTIRFEQACLFPVSHLLQSMHALLVATAAGLVHWRRFRVPVTMALVVVMTTALVIMIVLTVCPPLRGYPLATSLIGGIFVFVQAMCWDCLDRHRTTYRSDVAFWLHMVAAPAIVHPVFAAIGLTSSAALLDGFATHARHVGAFDQTHVVLCALLGLATYVALGLVGLIVDRRAGLVSGLVYAVFATMILLNGTSAPDVALALTGMLVGGVLLLLSVFWKPARGFLLVRMPAKVRDLVPPP